MNATELRRIVLCADDYGISPGVNEAIRDLIARGRLNATSAMVVAPSLTDAEAIALAELKRGMPQLQIGLHFTLTAPFRPASDAYTPLKQDAFLPLTTTLGSALIARLDRARVAQELRAQIGAFSQRFGFLPDYVDGHQHVQIFPQIRDAALTVMRDMLPNAWMRQCGRVTPLAARVTDRKSVLVVPAKDANVLLSSRNVQGARVVVASEINTYDIMNANKVLIVKDAIAPLEATLTK